MALIPFDDRDGLIWQNGEFVDWRDAKVHILSHGLHYGSCVFEGVRAYGGEIFKLREHTERLFASAELMGFEIPYTMDEIDDACRDLLAKMNIKDGYLRPVAWRGSEMMAVSAQKNTIHVAIAAWEWPSYFSPEARMKGISLDWAKYKRPSPDTAPCIAKAAGLYMICTLSKHEAEANGYDDALMEDYRGYIAEATGANVFFVKDGEIHTPIADCFLDGITRRTVIGLAEARQLKVNQRHIMPEELSDMEEMFLCGTAVEVTPVSNVGDRQFTVGETTKALMMDYHNLVNGN